MVWEHRNKTHKALDSGVQFCLTAMMQCRELASLALSIWDNFLVSVDTGRECVLHCHSWFGEWQDAGLLLGKHCPQAPPLPSTFIFTPVKSQHFMTLI